MKLLQLQLLAYRSGNAVFGRLNRSRSASVGGNLFFVVAVDGRCSDGTTVVDTGNGGGRV